MIFYLTTLCMFTKYDDILLFVCTNCGGIDNDQRCCPMNFDVCCCCTWWKRKAMNASVNTRVLFTCFTGLSSMGLYILSWEVHWEVAPVFKVFLMMEFYGFLMYYLCLALMYQFCSPEEERAAYHIANSRSESQVRDELGSRTAALN